MLDCLRELVMGYLKIDVYTLPPIVRPIHRVFILPEIFCPNTGLSMYAIALSQYSKLRVESICAMPLVLPACFAFNSARFYFVRHF